MRHHYRHFGAIPLVLSLLCAAPAAWPQAHEMRAGPYTVRGSTVGSEKLSAATASKHGIERSPLRGVLNVTVMNKTQTVPARIEASARNLTGHTRPIPMQETSANGYVSYTGTYDFVHGEVLDFIVQAQPQGSAETLKLNFRDRMWGPGDLPESRSKR